MKMAERNKCVVFIVGPTGTGKSELALHLASRVSCELISADAMQVYRGMDIITDKPPAWVRRRHPHRMTDVVSPAGDFNVARFVRGARRAINAAWRSNKLPVVVGGTGLYVDALLYGIFEDRSGSRKVRRLLERRAQAEGSVVLHERLKEADPAAAARISPHDARRIIRALEVYEVARQPISALQKKRKGLTEECRVFLFGLRRDRADRYGRIERRVDAMIQNGLLDEVRRLLRKKLSRTASMCIGMREIEGFLKGQMSLEEAVRLIKRNSRRYAKRQMTWFRKNKEIQWIDIGKEEDLASVAQEIAKRIHETPWR